MTSVDGFRLVDETDFLPLDLIFMGESADFIIVTSVCVEIIPVVLMVDGGLPGTSKGTTALMTPFRFWPWYSKTMSWSVVIAVPLKALIKFFVISSAEYTSATSKPRFRKPTSMSMAWIN